MLSAAALACLHGLHKRLGDRKSPSSQTTCAAAQMESFSFQDRRGLAIFCASDLLAAAPRAAMVRPRACSPAAAASGWKRGETGGPMRTGWTRKRLVRISMRDIWKSRSITCDVISTFNRDRLRRPRRCASEPASKSSASRTLVWGSRSCHMSATPERRGSDPVSPITVPMRIRARRGDATTERGAMNPGRRLVGPIERAGLCIVDTTPVRGLGRTRMLE